MKLKTINHYTPQIMPMKGPLMVVIQDVEADEWYWEITHTHTHTPQKYTHTKSFLFVVSVLFLNN